tara:strand:- start:303 stop:809 length:507 start_codon:yes stop_codon:yes gene_type:complete
MKKILGLLTVFAFSIGFSFSQKKRVSPKETTTGEINGVEVSINYCAPSVKGRKIWGELVPYDKIWRAGANEATTMEFGKDISIQNNKLPAGKYSFFVIPNKEKCTLIFNNDFKQWGSYNYSMDKDQLRIDVRPILNSKGIEKLVYEISDKTIYLKWSNWIISFDISSE